MDREKNYKLSIRDWIFQEAIPIPAWVTAWLRVRLIMNCNVFMKTLYFNYSSFILLSRSICRININVPAKVMNLSKILLYMDEHDNSFCL